MILLPPGNEISFFNLTLSLGVTFFAEETEEIEAEGVSSTISKPFAGINVDASTSNSVSISTFSTASSLVSSDV